MAGEDSGAALTAAQQEMAAARASGDSNRIAIAQRGVDAAQARHSAVTANAPGSSGFGDWARAQIMKYSNAAPIAKALDQSGGKR